MKVLYLSAWYPTERDKMSGLFVAKHKEAVERQGVDVRVVYTEETGLRYWKEMRRQLKALWQAGWRPDVVQLNVITKNALIALYLKKRYHIPYIIVEHWTGYLPINMQFKGFLRKLMVRTAAREAARIMPVSQDLVQAMRQCGLEGQYEVVNNVVDDFFYAKPPLPKTAEQVKTILHISCMMEEHKNVFGLLRATQRLYKERQDFRLVIIGDGVDYSMTCDYANSLGMSEGHGPVAFVGEKTPKEVCEWFRKADFFVLNSNYENAPVVLSEALATGCPILSTDVGGIREMVPPECGILITTGDEDALVSKMHYLLDHYQDYSQDVIRQYGQRYSYQSVGQHLRRIYDAVSKGQ